MSILILGIIKVIDNIITTAKNIAVYKNKKIIASSLVAISQMMFNTLTKLIVAEDSLFTDIVVFIPCAILISNKTETIIAYVVCFNHASNKFFISISWIIMINIVNYYN